ncbi:MAG TPA: GlsB/YeaQ/YmgE family stress response membrane protein [Kofleriaceae bacterium]|nr:GlsB/YeaQ/YmgE family stress response membrane protein [Kofleriaceae bacterium]
MSILWILFVGLIVGAFARLLMPGRGPSGLIVTSFLGVLGAVTAHLIGVAGGWYRDSEPAGFIASVLGSMLLLWLYRGYARRRVAREARAARRAAYD